jgi:hypothetical protein
MPNAARGRRTRPRDPAMPAGPRPKRARFEPICNVIGDVSQRVSDTKFRHPEVRAAQFAGWAERSEAHVLIDDRDDQRGHGALAHPTFAHRGACHRAGHFGPDPLARTSPGAAGRGSEWLP